MPDNGNDELIPLAHDPELLAAFMGSIFNQSGAVNSPIQDEVSGRMQTIIDDQYAEGISPEDFLKELLGVFDTILRDEELVNSLISRETAVGFLDKTEGILEEQGFTLDEDQLDDYQVAKEHLATLDGELEDVDTGQSNDLIEYFTKLPPGAQLLAFSELFAGEQGQLLRALEDNPEALLALSPDVREELGLSTDDEALKEQYADRLRDREPNDQLAIAYQWLRGWDPEAEEIRLSVLKSTIDTTPTELIGVLIPSVKETYQRFYEAASRRHEALLMMYPLVFEAEEGREDALRYLTVLYGGEAQESWNEMLLPDLVDRLDSRITYFKNHNDVWRAAMANEAPVAGEDSDLLFRDAYYVAERFVTGQRGGFLWQKSGFRFATNLVLFLASMISEPIDWVVTGSSILRDLIKGEWDKGTSFDLATLLIPGSVSQLRRVAGRARRLLVGADDFLRYGLEFSDNANFNRFIANYNQFPSLENVDFRGMRVWHTRDAMDALARQAEDYPEAFARIRGMYSSAAPSSPKEVETDKLWFAATSYPPVEITFNANIWNEKTFEIPPLVQGQFMGVGKTLDFQITASHEGGHVFWYWILSADLTTRHRIRSRIESFLNDNQGVLIQISPGTFDRRLTSRGAFGPELFAESFAALYHPEGVPGPFVEDFRQLLEEITEDISSSSNVN